ncbi:MAG: TolC family protein [Campylobacteraceae bacterium]|nr:TolC family protein [Campylobacteraceae bacterium]
MKRLLLIAVLPFILEAKQYEFDEILKKALENNKELKAKKLNLEIAKARLKEISSKKFGEISLNENFSRTNHAAYVFMNKLSSREVTQADFAISDLNDPKTINNFETTAEYRVPLFTGFMLYNEEKAAKNMEAAALLISKKDEKKLALETLKAYNFAVASKRYVDAMEISYKSVEQIVKNTNEMYREKLASKTDIMEASLAKTTAEARLFEAKKNYETSIHYLRFLTDDESIDDVGTFYEVDIKTGNPEDREELKASIFMASAAKNRSDATLSEYLPKVVAFAKYGYNDNTFTTSSSKDFYMVGVGLSYSLTDFGAASAKREAARAEYLKASFEAASMKNYAKFDSKQKELDMKQKEHLLAQNSLAKQLATQIFENYKLKYQNGLTNISELLKKEAEASISAAKEIEAKAMYLNSKAEYKYTIGLGVKD